MLNYLIHELFPTNLLLLPEPVNFGTPYLPLPFLNPTTQLASNLRQFDNAASLQDEVIILCLSPPWHTEKRRNANINVSHNNAFQVNNYNNK